MITFNHKLYGDAELLHNTCLNVVDKPISICYRLRGESTMRVSSLVDAGLTKISFQ